MTATDGALADTIEIQRVKAEYCAAADLSPTDARAAADGLKRVLAADVRCDYGVARMDGADAVAAWLVDSIGGGSRWMWHAIHTPRIRVDGDMAEAGWTVIVRSQGTDGAARELFGRYHDRFRRTPDGWRICDIRLELIG